jgi:predicted dehydrogenase
MSKSSVGRREFIRQVAGSAAAMSALPPVTRMMEEGQAPVKQTTPRIKFAVVGINHSHINAQVNALIRGGGQLVSVYAKEPDLVSAFTRTFPQAKVARSEAEILEDSSIQLVASSIVPVERAPLGIRVMQHGKDYVSDKPGITTLEQLAEVRKVQAATKRMYSITYSERFENQATVKAGDLVKAGAIGKVIQTVGLGPHRMTPATRPAWFFDKKYYGGIICDIGSHQADQFLFFTNSTKAEVVSSQIGNVHNQKWPEFEDFADVVLRGNGGTGYVRLDWFTPDGLDTWGDGRLTILGTDGFIEVRKNTDIAGRGPGSYLFLCDQKGMQYIDCSKVELPYGPRVVDDVLNRTETAMPQAHCFLATELMLKAQKQAQVVTLE